MIEEKGPWTAAFGNDKTFIESDDFTHDVRLYVNGDFESHEQLLEYTEEIARRLNSYASRDAEVAELKAELETERCLSFRNQVAELEAERYQLRKDVEMLRDVLIRIRDRPLINDVVYKIAVEALAKVRKP